MGAAMSVGPRRFVRQGFSARDQSLTDVAKVHTFYSDISDTEALPGQIWVSYDITLYAPQMVPAVLQGRDVTQPVEGDTVFTATSNGTFPLVALPLGKVSDQVLQTTSNALNVYNATTSGDYSVALALTRPGVYKITGQLYAKMDSGLSDNLTINDLTLSVLSAAYETLAEQVSNLGIKKIASNASDQGEMTWDFAHIVDTRTLAAPLAFTASWALANPALLGKVGWAIAMAINGGSIESYNSLGVRFGIRNLLIARG
jgi:hypothetical protein